MKSIKRSIKKRGLLNTIVFLVGSIFYYLFRLVYDKILKHLKVNENEILFYSVPDYSDNGKVFYEYLVKNLSSKKYIWFVKNKIQKDTEKTKFVKFSSKIHTGPTLKALYYAATCKYIFYTHVSPLDKIKAKKDQIIINLWHGCGYKDSEKTARKYVEINYFDYVLVPGKVFIDTKSRFFGCAKEKVLPIGYPRYDLLLNEDKKTEALVKELKENNKLIVWMPTFRKTIDGLFPEEKISKNYDMPLLDSNDDFYELNEICKKNNIILCIKRHPFQLEYAAESLELSNIIFIDNKFFNDNNVELYSFLRYSDALITDYSSIAIDYLLLDKPIGFALADFDEYLKTRGFVFKDPLKYMPGYHIYNKEEIKVMLIDIAANIDKHKNSREVIMDEVHNKCDNYCERIKKEIFK